jgi:DNA polymerase III subunit delta'
MLAAVQHQTEAVKYLRRFVEGQLTSPLLLVGPEGVGRRFSVQQAVQEAFCTGTHEEGCKCSSCYAMPKGNHPDYRVLSPEGDKDIKVEDIRKLCAETRENPSHAKMLCFVIDGADRITSAAANAFLKTLEEPPKHVRLFLIAEETDRVLPTIRSRCGVVRYAPLPDEFILSMVQRYETDAAKALVYTRMGEGSVGNAVRYWGSGKLSLRDQVLRVLHLSVSKDLPVLFSAVDAIGKDLPLGLKLLEQLVHDVLIVRVYPMRAIHSDRLNDLTKMGQQAGLGVWSRLAKKLTNLQTQARTTRLNLAFHVKTNLVETFV